MNKIKYFRKIKGLSIYDLSDKTNLTPSYINNLENGHKNNPTKATMEKISIALDQTVSEIFYPLEV
ncbi:helix-turn-helix domain-containing protein [Clostridium niameyense]|uniref:helix-turn-helix domain-containing protein n=1 Tax=Clostridium niameyense TaxID=1622073 RepID=UPI00067E76CC|nr:helix-turn-helix transcriptional regulator [Clostridium niameyense]